ncbi:MAG: LuxR C-terminal-related transcriptional regulator [Ilumatobacteraceae bacterium]
MTPSAPELLATAWEAFGAGDFDVALTAATESLATAESPQAHQLLGGLAYVDDQIGLARRHWETAFRLSREAGQLGLAARIALELSTLQALWYDNASAAQGWSERARALLQRVGPCVEWGYLELAMVACERPDVDDLLGSSERALALAIEYGDGDLETKALADGGLALVCQGHVRAGFAKLDAAMAAIAAGEVGLIPAGIAFCSMLSACDRAGDVERAQQWTAAITPLIERSGGRPRILHTHCRVASGSVLSAAGRWSEAEDQLLAALGPPEAPNQGHRALAVAHLASLRVVQGRLDEAADLLAPFEDHVTSCAPLAQVLMAQDELDLAAAVLQRGRRELVGDAVRAGALLVLLVDVELRRGDPDAARQVADELSVLVAGTEIVALHADAAMTDARVLSAAGDDRAAIDRLHDALRILGSEERPHRLAVVRLELSQALAATGDVPAAIAEGRAALATFERLGATVDRDRAAALLRRLGARGRPRPTRGEDLSTLLTARELEVLALLRNGLTNAEIGARLFISAKTVEHHVGRILGKLGVRSRAEAAALAVRLAATPAASRTGGPDGGFPR